jgi:hypothetical protein
MKIFRSFLKTGARLTGVLVIVALSSLAAHAQSRDRALETVEELVRNLAHRLADSSITEKQRRAGLQGLGDALNRFVLSETERRAEDKIAPPTGALLRPGEVEPAPTTRLGEAIPLHKVPRDWFNLHVGEVQSKMEKLRADFERGSQDTVLVSGLESLLISLDRINRPPVP